MPVVTNTPLTLPFVVPDITSVLDTFDRIRWYRSRTGVDGLYEAATGPSATVAAVSGSLVGPFQVTGKTLSFRVNGLTKVDVAFSGSDPVSAANVAAAINLATGLVVAAPNTDGTLKIPTVATGSAASIEILSSEAAPFLGFDVGAAAVGLDLDTTLMAGTYQYFYTDQNSSSDFWYRTQYLSSSTAQISELSTPFTADQAQVVPLSSTAVAFVQIADASGRAISGKRVSIGVMFQPNRVNGYAVFRNYQVMQTDRNGYAQIRLIKGTTIDFNVDGSDFTRRIVVPNTDVFDLFDPSLVVEDEYGIQQPDIDFAVRTS